EWLFADDCFARFNNVDNFLAWYFFPESSAVNIRFPDGAYVNGFYIDSTLGNVQGIGYHVEIDSSTNCMWAAIPFNDFIEVEHNAKENTSDVVCSIYDVSGRAVIKKDYKN
ncbi:MAG: hypothetical protein ACUVQ3_09880, partial [bacterium]